MWLRFGVVGGKVYLNPEAEEIDLCGPEEGGEKEISELEGIKT